MKSQPTFVTVLCLLQLFVVGAGYLFTRVLVRSWDKNLGDWAMDPGMLTLPRFFATYGLLFLVLPALWCCAAVLSPKDAGEPGSVSRAQMVAGLVLTLALVVAFSFAVIAGVVVNFDPRINPLMDP
jgi:peptidoglycan/LPS O-acetylase OafA/YrhL